MPGSTRVATDRQRVERLLATHLGSDASGKVVEHFAAMKTALLASDNEKALLRSGKFVESVVQGVEYLRTGTEPSKINVGRALLQWPTDTKLPTDLRSFQPPQLAALYAFRSKRGGAHSSFDPLNFDSRAAVGLASCSSHHLCLHSRLMGALPPRAV